MRGPSLIKKNVRGVASARLIVRQRPSFLIKAAKGIRINFSFVKRLVMLVAFVKNPARRIVFN